jgi:hypothetical protein
MSGSICRFVGQGFDRFGPITKSLKKWARWLARVVNQKTARAHKVGVIIGDLEVINLELAFATLNGVNANDYAIFS